MRTRRNCITFFATCFRCMPINRPWEGLLIARGLLPRYPPPKKNPAISFNERFVAARHEEGCYEKSILKKFHVCKGLSNDDVGAARGTAFREIRPVAGFKTGDFVEEKLGGFTVERLREGILLFSKTGFERGTIVLSEVLLV